MHSRINVSDFNLAATLECGQAFRWSRNGEDGWFEGVVGREVWRLRQAEGALEWDCSRETFSRSALSNRSSREYDLQLQRYLALDASLPDIVTTFPPDDTHLHAAVRKHWGMRVLRQEPWECLASFMASSTKQIVQIRQIVAELSRRFGEPITQRGRDAVHREDSPVPKRQGEEPRAVPRVHGHAAAQPYHVHGHATAGPYHSFPTVDAIARTSHQELWDCKLGFRAKNLLAAARMIDGGEVNLDRLPTMGYERALEELLKLPGVGEKIANCTLLFSCGFEEAFPVDVWIERALRRLYFPRRKVTARQLREFARSHFGPHAGWAQQYLFFQERTRRKNRK